MAIMVLAVIAVAGLLILGTADYGGLGGPKAFLLAVPAIILLR
jgi:uncharacterized membrane protein